MSMSILQRATRMGRGFLSSIRARASVRLPANRLRSDSSPLESRRQRHAGRRPTSQRHPQVPSKLYHPVWSW